MQNYSTLNEADEEAIGVLVHTAEPSRARWNHIKDLDSFFIRMYHYHQRRGFVSMVTHEFIHLFQYVFVTCLTVYLIYGIDYSLLFEKTEHKHTIREICLSISACVANFTFWTWVAVLIAFLVFVVKLIRRGYQLFHFWDIKQFYNIALKIKDEDLSNLTWYDVQSRVRAVQVEQQMCIHKNELSELDIYHRILRQPNYLVAMINKKILPPRIRIPGLGEHVFWTESMCWIMQMLFFWTPWSLFDNPWNLRAEYKKYNNRHELAVKMKRQILWLAALYLVLSPVILVWQALLTLFGHFAIIRKEPWKLTERRWSLYGKMYLRHFNELDHELNARLSRVYGPGVKYLSAFTSVLAEDIASGVGFCVTAVWGSLIILSLYDEDVVLNVEHMLTILSVLSVVVMVINSFAGKENTPVDMEDLMGKVLVNANYLPLEWMSKAHTKEIRQEFEPLLPYTFIYLIESVLNPIVIPFVLYYYVHPRAIEFVDFFRNFTVTVMGVGDVCSFAQMEVKKHGNPDWHDCVPGEGGDINNDQMSQAENGKVEFSLIHFATTNPGWKMEPQEEQFIRKVRDQGSTMANSVMTDSHMRMEGGMRDASQSIGRPDSWHLGEATSRFDRDEDTNTIWRKMLDSRGEPPMNTSAIWEREGPLSINMKDMSANSAYLYKVYNNNATRRKRTVAQETTPLLSTNR